MKTDIRLTAKYGILQGFYWMLAAVAMAYLTPLLEGKGYTSLEIGILNGVRFISVFVFQVLLASFSDRHAKQIPLKYIVAMLTLISIIASLIFYYSGADFVLGIIIFILFGATINCISPLIDSLSIQYVNHGRNVDYAKGRACGSATWAIFCVVVGMFADCFGINYILLLQIFVASCFLVSSLFMDKVDFTKDAQGNDVVDQTKTKSTNGDGFVHSTWYVLRYYPKYTMFIVSCLFIFMGYNLNTTFMIYMVVRLGGNHTDYGLAQFVVAVSEIPTALLFYKMKQHFKVDYMMICCAVFATVRCAATAFAWSVPAIIIGQVFEMLGFGLFYAGSVSFVMENLSKGDVVKGTSLINVASVGIGEAIASVMCGIIRSCLGLDSLMLISIFVSGAGIVTMIIMNYLPQCIAKEMNGKVDMMMN